MKFDVKVVLDCLKLNSEVYTVRAWQSKLKYSVVEVNNVGSCVKEKISKVSSMQDIREYVHLSGFDSAQEWWDQVAKFGATDGWLYHVSVLEVEVF